jgi:hypothetical protein
VRGKELMGLGEGARGRRGEEAKNAKCKTENAKRKM